MKFFAQRLSDAIDAFRFGEVDYKFLRRIVMDYSKPFDVHTWSDHPEVDEFAKPIFQKHFEGRKQDVLYKHVKVLLLDLFVNWTIDPQLKTVVSRSPNDYKAGTRYNELHISRTTIKVIDTLKAAGLLKEVRGYFVREHKRGRLTRIWPTPKLRKMFADAKFGPLDIQSHPDRLSIILRDKIPGTNEVEDVEYEPTEETERMSEFMAHYNSMLCDTFIDIPILSEQGLEYEKGGERKELFISQSDKFVRRIFSRRSFECNGRFNGGWWQNCPKEFREHIFLNDQPTNEIDYSGLHIVMLYALEGVDYWKMIRKDPYLIEAPEFMAGNDQQCRSVAKNMMLMLLNAESEEQAIYAFRHKAKKGSREKRYKDKELKQVCALLHERHPQVSKHFGKDVGIKLMNLDSKIAEFVLSRFVNKSIPVLSLHDSYIVPTLHEDMLSDVMRDGFEKIMGVPLGFGTDAGLKEKQYRVEELEADLSTWMPYDGFSWQEEEEAYRERAHPKRTERYQYQWNEFQKWRAQRK